VRVSQDPQRELVQGQPHNLIGLKRPIHCHAYILVAKTVGVSNTPGAEKPPQVKVTNDWRDDTPSNEVQISTSEYKIEPINLAIRQALGAAPPFFQRVPRGYQATVWIGFSADEIGRMKDSRVSYIRHTYPLIDLGMDRDACQRWLARHGWTVATDRVHHRCRIFAITCPYTGNAGWRRMRDQRPSEWADAVAFDHANRHGGARGTALTRQAFLHRSRLPLDQAPIDRPTRAERRGTQLDLLAELGDPDGCSPYGWRSGTPA